MEALYGGSSIEESSSVFLNILKGQGTVAQVDVVAANAGMAIHCVKPELSIFDCIGMAKESIYSGSAFSSLNKLIDDE